MTERFVPTEPGFYWIEDMLGVRLIAHVTELDIKRSFAGPAAAAMSFPGLRFIAPVPPPDVVQKMADMLNVFSCECSGRCEQYQWLPADNADCAYARARAILAKLGKGGA